LLKDITLNITPEMLKDVHGNLLGHLGTHFDVMDKEFPLEYTCRKGIVFDVSGIRDREIDVQDIDLDRIGKEMFVAFCSGFIEEYGYGTSVYRHEHPELSDKLIDVLLKKEISIIGIDFAGVRRGKQHAPKDQYCADHGVFIVENLCNLKEVPKQEELIFHTYPMNCSGISGLPCRVIVQM